MAENPSGRAAFVEEALAQFDLGIADFAEIRVTNNAVFRLHTPAGDYALRIHRPGYRLRQQIRSELTYVAALAEGSEVIVPHPVRTRSGDVVASVEVGGEVRHASVVTWLEGAVLRPGRGAGRATLFRIGRALARIHLFSETFDPPDGFDLPTLDIATRFNAERLRLIETRSLRGLVDQLMQRAGDRFAGLTRTPASYGVLHNDFILLNCLHSGRRTAVIDFDDSGWGFYLQDLGGLLGNLKDYGNYRTLRRWFVDGYESVRPFPTADRRDLELMIALRHCTTALWLHERRAEAPMLVDRFEQNIAYRIEEIESALTELAH